MGSPAAPLFTTLQEREAVLRSNQDKALNVELLNDRDQTDSGTAMTSPHLQVLNSLLPKNRAYALETGSSA